MCGCSEIQFHLPVLDRFRLATLLKGVLDPFFDSKGATCRVCGAVAEEAFRKFVVCVAFPALLKLRDPPQMSCSIMEFSQLVDLVAIFLILFVMFLLFELKIVCVRSRIR